MASVSSTTSPADPATSGRPGAQGDPCLLENQLAGEPDTETVALADQLSAELAALKIEMAPEPEPALEG